MNPPAFDVVTVTLNPAIDRTITIPRFTAGTVNRVAGEHANPGGKGVNVASALADHGHSVAVTGFLGRENAATFEELFLRKKIADHFVRIAGQTRVGIKISDPELHQTTDINFAGAAPDAADLDELAAQLAELDAGCFVVAGSLPPGVDPGFYREVVGDLRTRSRRVVLDASGEPLRLALDARPHLIKPNIDELGDLLGRGLSTEAEVITAARELVGRGIEQVVVSMGRAGACFVSADSVVVARPPEIEVRSTVGAGDAMVAGIIAAHLGELPPADAARVATAFSMRALARDGAAESVAAWAARVTIETPPSS